MVLGTVQRYCERISKFQTFLSVDEQFYFFFIHTYWLRYFYIPVMMNTAHLYRASFWFHAYELPIQILFIEKGQCCNHIMPQYE